jgi:hypothetical protein
MFIQSQHSFFFFNTFFLFVPLFPSSNPHITPPNLTTFIFSLLLHPPPLPPRLLTPLKNKPRRAPDGSPISILRAKCPKNDMRTIRSPARSLAIKHGAMFSPSDPRHEKRNIKMSIFNGTKLIPPKQAIFDDWLNEAGINYESESDSDAFMSPTKEHFNQMYQQNSTPLNNTPQAQLPQPQPSPGPFTPSTPQQQLPQQQHVKSCSFASPASSINSDAGSTPMKSAKMRQPTPAIRKGDQIQFDDDDDDEFSLPEEFSGEVVNDQNCIHDEKKQCLSPTPEGNEYDNSFDLDFDNEPEQNATKDHTSPPKMIPTTPTIQRYSQQSQPDEQQFVHTGPMTRRRSLAAQQQLQQQQQQQQQPVQQIPQQEKPQTGFVSRPKPLTRSSMARTQHNISNQQQQRVGNDKVLTQQQQMQQVHQNRQQQQQQQPRSIDPIDQELIDGMNALSF